MKFAVLFVFVFVAFTFASFAQNAVQSEWIRVEGENKEVSVSIPSDFLVDAVRKDEYDQKLRIISFQNNVQMEFLVYDGKNPQKSLKRLKVGGESKTISSGDGSFTLKRIPGDATEDFFSETIFLASKKYLYCFYIRAENADKSEVSRFLYSIKAGEKPIFVNKSREKPVSEKIIPIDELKTSSEVLTALNQSFESQNRKISYEFKKIKPEQPADDFSIRPVIFLVDPFPSGTSLAVRPAFLATSVGRNSGTAVIKMKFLANGQLGDVTVYSISDRKILYEFVEGIKKIRFLPAMKNGKFIDSELSIEFEFPYY